jgi:hypothetical protein
MQLVSMKLGCWQESGTISSLAEVNFAIVIDSA